MGISLMAMAADLIVLLNRAGHVTIYQCLTVMRSKGIHSSLVKRSVTMEMLRTMTVVTKKDR